jgi:hypothetical protein
VTPSKQVDGESKGSKLKLLHYCNKFCKATLAGYLIKVTNIHFSEDPNKSTSKRARAARRRDKKGKIISNKHREDNILGLELQASKGELARKSNKIAQTPAWDVSAEVTASAKNSEKEQAHHKKSKQEKKKELAKFFGQGPPVPAPSREGTPIDIVVNKREDRRTNLKGGGGGLPSKEAAHLKGPEKVKAKKNYGQRMTGKENREADKKSCKRTKRNHPVKDQMMRHPGGARWLNPMMKDWRSKGIDPMAPRRISRQSKDC